MIYDTIALNDTDWTYDVSASKGYLDIPPINMVLNSSDFEESTGGKVYIRYEESINNFLRESCEYNIVKPEFLLSPSPLEVSCSVTPISFTVSNENNTPGPIEYQWQVGSGWLYNGNAVSNFTTTSNSISLTPYSYPPSDVKVRPMSGVDGYNQLISSVSLGDFNPTYPILGNNQLCSTALYSVDNLPTGTSVTGWSISNTNIASISSSGNQATLTANGNGSITVTASLINACGQTGTITKNNIDVGAPTVTNTGINGGYDNEPIRSYSQLNVGYVPGNNIQYYWTLSLNNSNCTPANTPKFLSSGTLTYTSNNPYATVSWGECTGIFTVVAWAKNSCGNTYIGSRMITIFDSDSNPCARTSESTTQRVYPNPVKKGGNIHYKEHPGDPCNGGLRSTTKSNTDVKIYDLQGQLKFERTYKTNNFTIKNINLDKGTYIMNIYSTNGIPVKELLVID